jgi:excisionase family DNA binding protein
VDDKLMTATEVANWLRISKARLYVWIKNGDLPVLRLPGGQFRFLESDVMAYLHRS